MTDSILLHQRNIQHFEVLYICAWEICSNILSACLPGTGAPGEQTVILSIKHTSNEITGMGSLHLQFECRCLVVNRIPQMLRCRIPFIADIWKQTRGNLKQKMETDAIPPKCDYFKTWCYGVGVYNIMVAQSLPGWKHFWWLETAGLLVSVCLLIYLSLWTCLHQDLKHQAQWCLKTS